MDKSADAFRTISEVAGEVDLPQHVLRFWETRFPQIKPLKRAGGRRYYRPRDIEVLRAIKHLLYGQGYTIKGVQRVLKQQGAGAFAAARDAANESRSELSFPAAGELPLLQGSPPRQGERAGNSTVHSGDMQPPAESHASADRDDSAGMTGEGPMWPLALTSEQIVRLRAALAELTACEDILEAARRR
ncbi:MAG: MerR family transcriptional regulator [Pseudomonadota bacterium]|nr:MerR family transcriptional regulator [Pseudomonadota bacterium]